jgi:hypothetical protein
MPYLSENRYQGQLLLLSGLLQEKLGVLDIFPTRHSVLFCSFWGVHHHFACLVLTISLQPLHKTLHKTAGGKTQNGILHKFIPPKVVSKPDPVTGFYNPFPTFSFTGSVRPVYPLSPRRTVPKSIKQPDWAVTGIPKGENRLSRTKIAILDAKGQEAMRKVCRYGREVLDIVAAAVKPGVTTDYLDEICHNACLERNVSGKGVPSR